MALVLFQLCEYWQHDDELAVALVVIRHYKARLHDDEFVKELVVIRQCGSRLHYNKFAVELVVIRQCESSLHDDDFSWELVACGTQQMFHLTVQFELGIYKLNLEPSLQHKKLDVKLFQYCFFSLTKSNVHELHVHVMNRSLQDDELALELGVCDKQ